MIKPQIIVVQSILAVAVGLFISDKFSTDVVALLAVPALLLSGVLNVSGALAGFANPAVLTLAAIFIETAGLTSPALPLSSGHFFSEKPEEAKPD